MPGKLEAEMNKVDSLRQYYTVHFILDFPTKYLSFSKETKPQRIHFLIHNFRHTFVYSYNQTNIQENVENVTI